MNKNIIEEFNNNNNIKNVIEVCTGDHITKRSLCCPIHNGDNKNGAAIKEGRNIFTCFSRGCISNASPWSFIQAYYKLGDFKSVAIKVNELFSANIPIYQNGQAKSLSEPIKVYDEELKVENYLSEKVPYLKEILKEHNHLLINANTGLGKTYGISELTESINTDYVIFLVPPRAIAEQVAAAKEYNFSLFYGDDVNFPKNKFIVSTYSKIDAINRAFDEENQYRSLCGEMLISYTVIVDEVHELMSKRTIMKSVIALENFIKDSDYSIMMSANTKDINGAYKNKGYFNKYINVAAKEKHYNSDKTFIYRISRSEKVRVKQIIDKIEENIYNHKHVLLMEDSKTNLDYYSQLLTIKGIPNIVINADNKTNEEVQEEYNSIINNSTLESAVILCTSVINAGVNIKNDNVCSMVIQNRLQLDTNKVIQFFGRVRKDNNNTCILMLEQGEQAEFKSTFESKLNYYSDYVTNAARFLNEGYFNQFGNDTKLIIEQWKLTKSNELFSNINKCIYIENGVFKVDHIMIYEKSRIEWLRSNYYDNDFIIEQLQDLKTRSIEVITINSSDKVDPKELFKVDNTTTIIELLSNIYNSSIDKEEFYQFINGNIDRKHLKGKAIKILNKLFSEDKLYKSLRKELKTILPSVNRLSSGAAAIVFDNILSEYIKEQKTIERKGNIESLKIAMIYNYDYPLGSNSEDIKAIGNIEYYVVRRCCDCFVGSNHNISKRAYKEMYIIYIALKGGDYKDNKYIDNKGKEVKPKKMIKIIDKCIDDTYLKAKDNRIISLR